MFVCFIFRIQKVLRLLVASSDGCLYVYNLDMAEGGECPIWKQHRYNKLTLSFYTGYVIYLTRIFSWQLCRMNRELSRKTVLVFALVGIFLCLDVSQVWPISRWLCLRSYTPFSFSIFLLILLGFVKCIEGERVYFSKRIAPELV